MSTRWLTVEFVDGDGQGVVCWRDSYAAALETTRGKHDWAIYTPGRVLVASSHQPSPH